MHRLENPDNFQQAVDLAVGNKGDAFFLLGYISNHVEDEVWQKAYGALMRRIAERNALLAEDLEAAESGQEDAEID
jgi:hypothetical protein